MKLSLRGTGLKLAAVCMMTLGLTACNWTSTINKITTVLGVVKGIATIVSWFPPASDLATFDASQSTQYFSLQNMSLTSTTGNIVITISDENTGTVLGQQTFGYQVSNNVVTFTNPLAVTSWVRSFSNYGGYVKVSVNTTFDTTAPPSGDSGTASTTFNYSGTPYASASATISGGSCSSGTLPTQTKQICAGP